MTASSPHRSAAPARNDSPFPPYPPPPLWRRALAAASAFRRRHNILRVTKDGGPESTVWAHWLFESKRWGSIVLLRFENGSRDAYHSHAFDCVSWVLAGGGLVEHRIGGPGANLEEPYLFLPSARPVITRRAHLHKVISCGRTWVLSLRGPWADNWQEVLPDGQGGERPVHLTHGRKEVRAAQDERWGVFVDTLRDLIRSQDLPGVYPTQAAAESAIRQFEGPRSADGHVARRLP